MILTFAKRRTARSPWTTQQALLTKINYAFTETLPNPGLREFRIRPTKGGLAGALLVLNQTEAIDLTHELTRALSNTPAAKPKR